MLQGRDFNSIAAALDELARQVGVEPIIELIDVYVSNSNQQMAKIQAAFQTGDVAEVKREAHSLKSSSANMGAEAFAQVCLQLEKATTLDMTAKAQFAEASTLHAQALQGMEHWKSIQKK